MIKLRDYQCNTVSHVRVREQIKPDTRMIVQAPTGGGKTIIQAMLLTDPIPQLILYHRRIIIDQTARVLDSYGIPYGFRCAGKPLRPGIPVQLGMVQTEFQRSFKTARTPIHNAKRVMIDEGHAFKGDTAVAVATRYNLEGASVVYFTATPMDMGGVVDECHVSTTVSKLIQQGHLVQPKVFAIEQPDPKELERLRRDGKGEYLAGDVARITHPRRIQGRVIQNYKRLNPDGRAFILFAHSVQASIYWAQYFTGQGIPTAHVDGNNIWVDGKFYKSDTSKRREVFERVESGDLKGLSNRFVLREGVDLPCIGHAILTSPVGSRVSFVQMCGRVLRPYAGREYAVIQDHSGTTANHPALDSEQPWDWWLPAGVSERAWIAAMRENAEPEPIICPECTFMRYTGDICPNCGFQYKKYARYVQESNGELRLQVGKQYKPRAIRPTPTDAADWSRAYWGAKKYNPNRTFEQLYAYFAVSHHWRWLPRDLPLMPRESYQWFLPVGDVPVTELVPA